MGASQNLHFLFISPISAATSPPPTHPESGHSAPIKPQHSSCGIVHRPPLTSASSRRRFLSAQPSSSRLPPWKRCADRSDRVTATLHARTMAENSEVKSPSVPHRNICSIFLFCGTDSMSCSLSCPYCSDTNGLCRKGKSKKNFFSITLSEDFEQCTVYYINLYMLIFGNNYWE